MAKLIVKFDNDVLDHIEIKQGDMKVGRKPGCDVHLDNLAVSGEHANLFTIGDDSFIQDLGSTNGTYINSKRITKHHLRNGDVVNIGRYSLVFLSDSSAPAQDRDDFAKTIIISPATQPIAPTPPPARTPAATPPSPAAARSEPHHQAALFVLSGANSGKRIDITKNVTSLGRTGKRAGTITRTADGYLIMSVDDDGEEPPKLNGRSVSAAGHPLKNGDVIEVAGTRLQFYLR